MHTEMREPQTVGIVGLGLIGGSLAMALKAHTGCRVIGFERCEPTAMRALAEGAIDQIGAPGELGACQMVFLCLYPAAAVDYARQNGAFFAKGAIVCDVSGVKRFICAEMPVIAAQHGFIFVGAHPMAGKERGGYENAESGLFAGASFLITPCGAPAAAVEQVKALAAALGFGGVVVTTPEEHDRMIAFTSQLPHALACAYVLSPQCPHHNGFSAGSYRDVSRVARINETLWSELFLENREPLTAELDTLIANLQAIRAAVAGDDREALEALLRRGKRVKEQLWE